MVGLIDHYRNVIALNLVGYSTTDTPASGGVIWPAGVQPGDLAMYLCSGGAPILSGFSGGVSTSGPGYSAATGVRTLISGDTGGGTIIGTGGTNGSLILAVYRSGSVVNHEFIDAKTVSLGPGSIDTGGTEAGDSVGMVSIFATQGIVSSITPPWTPRVVSSKFALMDISAADYPGGAVTVSYNMSSGSQVAVATFELRA